ncbi:MAG: hypothetical protein KDD35_01075, partial [Bdellovibrionales bacterium]|nr:hypothetical protein [Bdellovibrionales bacterium]
KATPEDLAFISFRLSWSYFNLGQTKKAIKFIQLAINRAKQASLHALHQDLMLDYATMMAKNPFGAEQLDAFIQLSPPEDKTKNLRYLAEETDRLGNRRASLLVWNLILIEDSGQNRDQAEIQLRLAQNFYDLNNYTKTLEHLEQASSFIKKGACASCENVGKDFKSFLVSWTKKEKIYPSFSLLSAYQKFIDCIPDDFEVIVWAAQIARQRKDLKVAYILYEKAAIHAAKNKMNKELEASLVSGIEVAESDKSKTHYARSLNLYLELNPKGPIAYNVKYQLAYLLYTNKKYAEAAQAFNQLALDPSPTDKKLQVQAADLSLDALKLTGKDLEIRNWSQQYAKKIPHRSSYYQEIGRKVTINQIVSALKSPAIDESLVASELAILQSFSIAEINSSELPSHYRSIILAAENIKDLKSIEYASLKMLGLKLAKADDKDLAKKSLLWIYELRLEFNKAYSIAREMKLTGLNRAEKELKLGLLAELAGKNPDPHFNSFVKHTNSLRKANQIRLKSIRRSSYPWSIYDKMSSRLRSTPDLFAQITLENYLRQPKKAKIQKALSLRSLRSTPEGIYLANLIYRQDFDDLLSKIRRSQLKRSSEKQLQRSIKERIRLLSELKNFYTGAIKNSDLYLQARTLESISSENSRFYRQLSQLPTPRGLSKSERVQYRQLLNDRAQAFKVAASEADELLKNLFSVQSNSLEKMRMALMSEDLLSRKVTTKEYYLIKRFLPKNEISKFTESMSDLKISKQKVVAAYQKVKKKPFDLGSLRDLREIEMKQGNGPLIAYLDERLSQLGAEARR